MSKPHVIETPAEYVDLYYDMSGMSIHELDAEDILDSYLEECNEEGVLTTINLKDIERYMQEIAWEEKNTCDCFNGCNYCLITS